MFYEFSIRLRQFMENLSIGKIQALRRSSKTSQYRGLVINISKQKTMLKRQVINSLLHKY